MKPVSEVFELMVDVNHFGEYTAKEISVRVVDNNYVEIHGKQQWRPHPGGTLRREFVQKLLIPTDCDTRRLTASMTGGKLTIRAPKVLHLNQNPALRLQLRHALLGSTSDSLSQISSDGSPVSKISSMPSFYGQVKSPKSVTLGGVTEITYVQ